MRMVLVPALLLVSCSGAPAPAPAKPLHDYRGIIHCHSLFSHDSKGSYEEILAAAKAAQVDFICMTDHPPKGDPGKSLREGWKGLHDGVLFIQGAEYSDNILAIALKEPIQFKDRRGTIRAIHEQGGLAFACHPEEITDWSPFEEADGMEIYNVHAALKRKSKEPDFLARAVKLLKEDPDRTFTVLQELDPAILAKWDELNQKRRFVGIAGNDSHQNVNFLGLQLDPYPRAFKFVSTHVRAEELTEEAILAALKKGRCHVQFDVAEDQRAPCLDWPGSEIHSRGMITIPWRPDDVISWSRDGRPTRLVGSRITGENYGVVALDEPGVYRPEYRLAGSGRPWLLPNPIYFRPQCP